jgi:chemotaxis protein methyltransferase CheR
MTKNLADLELSPAEFEQVRELVYRISRIDLHAGKEGLVKTRLLRRLRELGLGDMRTYLRLVEADATGAEVAALVDVLTTNKTSFFREAQHFDFLRAQVLPERMAEGGGPLRYWSAGCSTGEEAYTLAMVLCEALPEASAKAARILATDISARVLAEARAGVYSAARVQEVPPALRQKYFARASASTPEFKVAPRLQEMVRFAQLNLMDAWPMRGPFDAIFCRNVMIYFDRATQERLVQRFWELLSPDGHLFVGHSESLTALEHRFDYVQPAVYRK